MNESGTFFDKRTEHFFLIFMKEIKPKHTLKKIIEHFFLSFFLFFIKAPFFKERKGKKKKLKVLFKFCTSTFSKIAVAHEVFRKCMHMHTNAAPPNDK